ncbi:MAG TPA: phosphonate C-P lyase system protein PhnG [Acidimicrobiales bacterium]|nr:phosphonate C-P lyase system protein PhnG [Acidimicrobiales bacterium]
MSETVSTDHREAFDSSLEETADTLVPRPLSTDELYEALARANRDELVALADLILETPSSLELVAGPSVVSSPIRLSMPGGTGTVVIGHVAMTSCEVSLDGVRGDGIRSGRSLEASIAAAICDAEVERDGKFVDRVHDLALATLRQLHLNEERRALATQLTKIGDE